MFSPWYMRVTTRLVCSKHTKRRWLANRATIIALLLALAPMTASAHQSPAGCNSSRLNLSIVRDHVQVSEGDTLTYTITVTNIDAGADLACDIDNATITLTLPAMDGSATGTMLTLVSGAAYPAGSITRDIGSAQYVVHVNPGVVDIIAQANITSTLHDAPVDHTASIQKTIGTSVVVRPAALSASAPSATAPPATAPAAVHLPGLPNTGSL
jgi:uncharacterized repeat protein (TIGR01451 family)